MDEFDFQLQEALARRKAGQQAAQSFSLPQGQIVGGRYIRPSFGDALIQGLRMYQGQQDAEQAGKQIAELTQGRQKAIADALRNFGQQAQGTPENAPGDGMGPVLPAQAPDMMGAYQSLLNAPDSSLRQMALQGMARIPEAQAQREARADEMRMRAEQRAQELQAQHQMRMDQLAAQNASREQMAQQQREFQQQMMREQQAARLQIAQASAANRPEKMATVIDPNTGDPVMVPQSQAAGMTPFNQQTAGTAKKRTEQKKAQDQLDLTVSELRSYYDDLRKGGGIVAEGKGPIGNIAARASSSGIGQLAGGAIGSKNQQLREKIEQTRPLLLNLIKNATGMSAQQMNSNAEMMLYLRSATDPTLSYEANKQALDNLQRLFGSPQDAAQQPASKTRIRFDANGNPIK